MEQYQFYLGVDWGTQTHELCLKGHGEAKVQRHRFEHTPHCLGQMMNWIEERIGGDWGRLAVAIERPHGLLVQILLARQAGVFAINPKKLDRFRERYNVAGAKSDELDALTLLETLQKDSYAYNQVTIKPSDELMLRELTHTLEDVEREWRGHCNQLWEMLVRYYPALLALTSGADEAWLWELLVLAPTPAQGAALSLETLGALLHRHRIRRLTPQQLLAALGQGALDLATGYVEAQAERTLILVRCAQMLAGERKRLEERIQAVLTRIKQAEAAAGAVGPAAGGSPANPAPEVAGAVVPATPAPTDYEIIDSIPGIGPHTLAVIYSEGIEPLRALNYRSLRSLAGAAPVTERSGKHCQVMMRYACNGRLRQALHHAANIACQQVDYWTKMYAGLRAKGHSHARSLRGLVDRMLKVLVSMLRHRRLFDPSLLGRVHAGH